MGGRSYFRSKKTWILLVLLSGSLLLITLLIPWFRSFVPQQLELHDNFSYTSDVISFDNFFDSSTNQYKGEVQSDTTFSYQVTKVDGDILSISNVFDVKTPTGEPIFAVKRLYGVDAETGKHTSTGGDKPRTGYLFGPANADKKDFVYWHINYDTPATMKFSDEEDILGLKTYHYTAQYTADQTQDLKNLPGVGTTKGINMDIKLDLWIEPLTGYLVAYEDHTTAYYYNLADGKRTVPWNQFHNRYSFDSLSTRVKLAEQQKDKVILLKKIVPSGAVILAALMGLGGLALALRGRRFGIKADSVLLLLTYGIGIASGCFWAFGGGVSTLNPVITPAYPGAAAGIIMLATVMSFRSKLQMTRKALLSAIIITLVAAAGFYMWIVLSAGAGLTNNSAMTVPGGTIPFISKLAALSVALICISLAAQLWRPKSRWLRYFAELLVSLTLVLGLACIVVYAFGSHLGWFAILHKVRVPAALGIVLLSVISFLQQPEWQFTKKFRELGRSVILSILVLFGLLLLTGAAWQTTYNDLSKQQDTQFQADVNSLHERIVAQLNTYASALRGGQSLFAASQSVEREEWKAYVDGLRLSQDYPGMQGFGFAKVVSSSKVAELTRQIRSEGYKSFEVRPLEPKRDVYSTIVFLEPFDNRNQRAFGFDMLSEPTRRSAMLRARDTGDIAMSGKVTLLQETNVDPQYGFLLYVPVYTSLSSQVSPERRSSDIEGYVYAPFRMNNFMRAAIGEQAKGVAVEVFDGDTGKLVAANQMYATSDSIVRNGRLTKVRPLTFGGQSWQLRYTSPALNLSSGIVPVHTTVLLAGLALSFILSVLMFVLTSSRQRAVGYANSLTKDLKRERDLAIKVQRKDEAILSSIAEGLIVFDDNGQVVRINKAAEEMLGYPEAELKDSKFSELVKAYDRSGKKMLVQNRPLKLVAKTGKAVADTRVQYARKDGSKFPVVVSIAPVKASGTTLGYIEIFRDVTAEYNLERAKDDFLSVASHQLRTPISAERWYLEILLDDKTVGKLSKAQKDVVQKIDASSKRLAELVTALLNVSRAESGRLTIKPVRTNINSLIKDVIQEVNVSISQRQQTIKLAAPRAFTLSIDPILIRQVVTNLLTNASKYSPNNSEITVTLESNRKQLTVSVIDHGYGIPMAQQANIFSKFFRADNAIKNAPEGNGLGLYLIKSIVEQSGGKISFESTENKGSTFRFTLPLSGSKSHQGEVNLDS